MQLVSLPQDKANHVIYGALIALVSFAVLKIFSVPHSPILALAACIIIGAAKEAIDYISNVRNLKNGLPAVHGVEFLDALATAGGGLLVFLAVMLEKSF